MKIKLAELEKKLNYKLQRDSYVLGVDTASITGLAIIETDKTYVKLSTSIFKLPAVDSADETSTKYVGKLESMLSLIREFKKELKPKKNSILILENSFLGVNPVTFGILRMLSGIIFAELYDIFEHIYLVFPMTARKDVGFKSQLKKGVKSIEKKKEIIAWINDKFNLNETNDNITDAILLALWGLKQKEEK